MSKKFNSPKNDEKFKKYWNKYVEDISSRENFRESHLTQLEILCDLHVEYDTLLIVLDLEGTTYVTTGRFGVQVKVHPCVGQKNKVVAEIRAYLKLLGLTLSIDSEEPDNGEEDEWV